MKATPEMIEAGAAVLAQIDAEALGERGPIEAYREDASQVINAALAAMPGEPVVENPPPSTHVVGLEVAIRNAGLQARDELLERIADGGTVDNDLADYMTRIVDACVRAAIRSTEVVG